MSAAQFNTLYAMRSATDWPLLRHRSTGRHVQVCTLVEGPLAYAIVEFRDGDSFAVTADELERLYETVAEPGQHVLHGQPEAGTGGTFTITDHTGRPLHEDLRWITAANLLRGRYGLRGVGPITDVLRAARVEPVVLALANRTGKRPA